jgi:hypothetical protein
MPFDPTAIVDGPWLRQTAHHELRVAWSSSAPPGTTFQVYIDRRLAWSGTATVAFFPVPLDHARVWVGSVWPGEETTDFGADLIDPYGDGDRANLSWYGGRYLDPNLVSFQIVGGPSAAGAGRGGAGRGGAGSGGEAAIVPASHSGVWRDGAGRGRAGRGGAGYAEVSYSWQSGPLTSGSWTFTVAPVGLAGIVGPPASIMVTIMAPPGPPAPLSLGGPRVNYTYDPSTRIASIVWGASPG